MVVAVVVALIFATVAPPANASVIQRNLPYGPAAHQRLDLYLPGGLGPHPVIVYAHGGGWVGGDNSVVSEPIAAMVSRGYAVASVGYLIARDGAPSWPTNVHDVKRAVRWLRAYAGTYRLDPDMVVGAGFSVGAQLALIAAATTDTTLVPPGLPAVLARQRADLQAVVSLAGVVDVNDFYRNVPFWGPASVGGLLGCGSRCSQRAIDAVEPRTYLTDVMPPVYLVHGVSDPVVRWQGVETFAAWYRSVMPPPVANTQLWIRYTSGDHTPNRANMDFESMVSFLNQVRTGRYARTGVFTDVFDRAFYADAVEWGVEQGITSGVGGGRLFAPVRNLSRAEATTMVWRALGQPAPAGATLSGDPFPDVPEGAWFADPVAWARSAGVVGGINGEFRPTQPVTRAQLLAIMWRAAGEPEPQGANPFVDVGPDTFFTDAAAWAFAAGITTGVDNRPSFAPARQITRGEAITLLYRQSLPAD